MFRTLRAVRFLFMAPVLLVMLFVISRMTAASGGDGDWFRWAALGIGIAWVISLIRVVQGIVVVGGMAALIAWLLRRNQQPQQQQYQTWQSGPPPPPQTPRAEEVPPSQTPPPPPWSGGPS